MEARVAAAVSKQERMRFELLLFCLKSLEDVCRNSWPAIDLNPENLFKGWERGIGGYGGSCFFRRHGISFFLASDKNGKDYYGQNKNDFCSHVILLNIINLYVLALGDPANSNSQILCLSIHGNLNELSSTKMQY
jgi:hypothetical protein